MWHKNKIMENESSNLGNIVILGVDEGDTPETPTVIDKVEEAKTEKTPKKEETE